MVGDEERLYQNHLLNAVVELKAARNILLKHIASRHDFRLVGVEGAMKIINSLRN